MSLSLFPFIPISDLWYLGTPRYSPWDSSMLICQICQVNLRWWIWYAVWSRRVWACKMPAAYQLAPGPGGILEQRPDGNVARPRNWKRSCARTRTQSDSVGPVGDSCKVSKSAAVCCLSLENLKLAVGTSSTAQGGGGSFKNRKPIGEVGCCESGMAERSHWWIERWLISLTLSLSFSDYLSIYLFIYLAIGLPIYLSIYLSICLSVYLSICLSVYLSICLPVYLSTCLSVYLSICLSVCLSICLPVYLSICLSIYLYLPTYLPTYLSIYLCIYLSIYLSICLSAYLSICLSIHLSICLPVYLWCSVIQCSVV